MTWVKICGMTNLEDALTAVDAGADAVGFVFYEKSPRNVSVETVREIVGKLPESVEKVGVFMGELQSVEIALRCGLGAIQTYPRPAEGPLQPHPAEDLSKLKSYLAVPYTSFVTGPDARPEAEGNLDVVARGRLGRFFDAFDAIFVDSGNALLPGGTGKAFDWRAAAPAFGILNERLRVVLAGGLNPDNVGEAMRILKPWGVDVASGVEARPGKKDPTKVRAFVKAVRDADRKDS
jgi:phosphoribosylanthranilate isomerase